MFEIVCYDKTGAAFFRFNTDDADTLSLMGMIPERTFGVLIHDAATGHYLDRA